MLTLNCYHYLQVFSFETLVKRYIFDFLSVKNFAIKSVKNSWIMRASIIWGLMSECQKKKISEKWNYRFFVLSVSFHEGGGYILDNVKKKGRSFLVQDLLGSEHVQHRWHCSNKKTKIYILFLFLIIQTTVGFQNLHLSRGASINSRHESTFDVCYIENTLRAVMSEFFTTDQ